VLNINKLHMVKLFRTIRQKLLQSGKLKSYAAYALGEIFLVMIGILLALQINNWNENRKNSATELLILKNILSDLKFNEERLIQDTGYNTLFTIQNKHLIEILKDPYSVYHDTLQRYFGMLNRYTIFFPKTMAYEGLKSKGLEIIKNDSLRASIVELYDETYYLNAHMIELRKDIYINSIKLFNKNLYTLSDIDLKVPTDFKALKNDQEFKNNLSHNTAENANFIAHTTNILSGTQTVKSLIEKEIITLTK